MHQCVDGDVRVRAGVTGLRPDLLPEGRHMLGEHGGNVLLLPEGRHAVREELLRQGRGVPQPAAGHLRLPARDHPVWVDYQPHVLPGRRRL